MDCYIRTTKSKPLGSIIRMVVLSKISILMVFRMPLRSPTKTLLISSIVFRVLTNCLLSLSARKWCTYMYVRVTYVRRYMQCVYSFIIVIVYLFCSSSDRCANRLFFFSFHFQCSVAYMFCSTDLLLWRRREDYQRRELFHQREPSTLPCDTRVFP